MYTHRLPGALLAFLMLLLALPSAVWARPLIIAHRGACGLFPEHTLAAYQQALAEGADFIEPDIVSSRDGVLIVSHENNLAETTDVAQKFPGRRRIRVIDGVKVTGWFSEDFTFHELKTLRVRQRFAFRSQQYNGRYPVPALEEVLQLLQAHQRTTGQWIGIYPETKHPGYFRARGLPLEEKLLALLQRYGYATATDPVFIQSFEVENLQQLHRQTAIRLIQLLEAEGQPADFTRCRDRRQYRDLLTPAGLKFIGHAVKLRPSGRRYKA